MHYIGDVTIITLSKAFHTAFCAYACACACTGSDRGEDGAHDWGSQDVDPRQVRRPAARPICPRQGVISRSVGRSVGRCTRVHSRVHSRMHSHLHLHSHIRLQLPLPLPLPLPLHFAKGRRWGPRAGSRRDCWVYGTPHARRLRLRPAHRPAHRPVHRPVHRPGGCGCCLVCSAGGRRARSNGWALGPNTDQLGRPPPYHRGTRCTKLG